MKPNRHFIQAFVRRDRVSALVAGLILGSMIPVCAVVGSDKIIVETTSTNDAPSQPKIPLPPLPAIQSTPALPSVTKDSDDSDDDDVKESGHSTTIKIGDHGHGDSVFEDVIIPLVSIVAFFGTPVLIVFFVCYYKYRRRQENLVTVREYLNKGLPVPPQLLDDSPNEIRSSVVSGPVNRGRLDLRKGFKYAFIGLGISLALYWNNPHSTVWAWGLIPLVMGVGYIISGWLELAQTQKLEETRRANPTPGTPP